MKHRVIFFTILLFLTFIFNSHAQQDDFHVLTGPYLGQKPPGMTPEVFAPGIISLLKTNEGRCVFSPDQNEFYFVRGGKNASNYDRIMVSRLENGIWTKPEPVSFTGKHIDFECSLSPDGNTMFFNRWSPEDSTIQDGIWMVERENLIWGVPEYLFDGNYVSVTENETLYFAKWIDRTRNVKKIFKTHFENGTYTSPQLVNANFNASFYKVNHPFIAPDESYIIFDVHHPPTKRNFGLYVSFKKENHEWSKAYAIDFGEDANMPYVSPDEKFLFYASEDNIYWVDAKIIKDLKSDELQ
jgi:hypothetical protein